LRAKADASPCLFLGRYFEIGPQFITFANGEMARQEWFPTFQDSEA